MHHYVPYLLKDIKAAHRKDGPTLEELASMTFDDEIRELEKYTKGCPDGDHPFGYYCGLDPNNFPPADQLSQNELKKVLRAFHQMMSSFNHSLDIPYEVPSAFAYRLAISSLNNRTVIMDVGTVHFDFCTGCIEKCELKEYCPCIEELKKIDLWDHIAKYHSQ